MATPLSSSQARDQGDAWNLSCPEALKDPGLAWPSSSDQACVGATDGSSSRAELPRHVGLPGVWASPTSFPPGPPLGIPYSPPTITRGTQGLSVASS